MKKYTYTPSGVKLVSVASATLLMGGGAMALLGKEVSVAFADMDETEFSADIGADEAFVAIHPSMKAALNAVDPRFVEAIILHEEGHCLLGHCTPKEEQKTITCPNGAVIFDNMSAELEADAHAANHLGAETVVSALTAAIDYILGLLQERVDENQLAEITANIMASVQPRLDALMA